jgi:superfamily II DNA/RNA helicase
MTADSTATEAGAANAVHTCGEQQLPHPVPTNPNACRLEASCMSHGSVCSPPHSVSMLNSSLRAMVVAAAARCSSRSHLFLSLTIRNASRLTRQASDADPRTGTLLAASTPAAHTRATSSPVDALPTPLAQAWLSLGLPPPSLVVVTDLHLRAPAAVQTAAIPSILAGKDVHVTGVTGSGKTLAFVLPLAARLKMHEEAQKPQQQQQQQQQHARPRLLILVPSKELASQTQRVVKAACHAFKLSCISVVGAAPRQQAAALQRPIDIVIATPVRALQLMESRDLHLSAVRQVVLDEVDTLFDSSFKSDTQAVLSAIKTRQVRTAATSAPSIASAVRVGGDDSNHGDHVQFVFVGATTSKAVAAARVRYAPNCTVTQPIGGGGAIVGGGSSDEGAPVVNPLLKHNFVAVDGNGDKLQALLSALDESPTIVFCRGAASARWLAHELEERGLKVSCLHGDLLPLMRRSMFESFRSSASKILVATDVASRGLDFPFVEHVISFDPPYAAEDVVHRAGRTARGPSRAEAPGSGRVTWIGTSRVLQFIRQVVEGNTGSSSGTSSKGVGEYGARKHGGSNIRASGGSAARHFDSSSLRRPSRRVAGNGSEQGASESGGRRPIRRTRYGEDDKGMIRGSEFGKRSRTDRSAKVARSEGGSWGGKGRTHEDVPRGRSNGVESVTGPGSSKAFAVDKLRSQRWRGSGQRQEPAVTPGERRPFNVTESSSRSRRPGMDTYAGKAAGVGGGDRGHRLTRRPDSSRNARGGWFGNRGNSNVGSDIGTTSSKKHKMRRPSLVYGRPGRK